MRRSDLALRAVRLLDGEGGTWRSTDIAQRLGSTPQFIPQVLAPLVKSGWIASEPGPRGGYRLAVDPAELSILDLVELIEGPTDDGTCVLRGGRCVATTHCALHDAWVSARTALQAGLDATALVSRPAQRRKKENSR